MACSGRTSVRIFSIRPLSGDSPVAADAGNRSTAQSTGTECVPVNDEVNRGINSPSAPYGFRIPAYGIKAEYTPGYLSHQDEELHRLHRAYGLPRCCTMSTARRRRTRV